MTSDDSQVTSDDSDKTLDDSMMTLGRPLNDLDHSKITLNDFRIIK